AVERGEIDLTFGDDRGSDNVVVESGFPEGPAFIERKGAKSMLSVPWVNHEYASVHHRGLRQERIAEPLFPDEFATEGFDHLQGATLGVEDDQALGQHCGGGPVVCCSEMPHLRAGARVKCVKV